MGKFNENIDMYCSACGEPVESGVVVKFRDIVKNNGTKMPECIEVDNLVYVSGEELDISEYMDYLEEHNLGPSVYLNGLDAVMKGCKVSPLLSDVREAFKLKFGAKQCGAVCPHCGGIL